MTGCGEWIWRIEKEYLRILKVFLSEFRLISNTFTEDRTFKKFKLPVVSPTRLLPGTE